MRYPRALVVLLCATVLVAAPGAAFADTAFAQMLGQLEQQYQLPSGILWKIALAESGGNSSVCASTSSACGMFQFIVSTWEADTKALFGRALDPSQRTSPDLSAKAAAYELAVINTRIGSLITQANVNLSAGLYLGYFLGSGGAQKLLVAYMQNPGQSACAILPPQCSANRSVMASRSVSQLISWAAQKMSVTGVPNVPGNFQCSDGTSYAYSYCDVNANNFLPANTVIPANPYGNYATVFPSATNGTAAPAAVTATPLPSAPQTPLPASYTSPTGAAATSGSTANSTACTPQYSCSNNTSYYTSSSCTQSVFEQCQYGCLGTICAPNPSAASSSTSLNLPQAVTNVSTPALNAFENASGSFFATSTAIGTSTSFASTGFFSVYDEATATSITSSGGDTSIGGEESGSSTFQGQPYSSTGFTQNVYMPAPVSPFDQILNQLKTALAGLMNYLGSL